MSEINDGLLMNAGIPPSWEDLASNRERLARIETKVDMVLTTLVVQDQKIVSLEARQLALETGRMANRADIERALADIELMRKERDLVDLSPAQFNEKIKRWDATSDTVDNNHMVAIVRRNMRKEEWAVLAALAAAAGTVSGAIPVIISLVRG